MKIKQCLVGFLIVLANYVVAQQITFEGQLLKKESVFMLKCIDSNKYKVRAYFVSVLDSTISQYKNVRFMSSSDTLSKSDFDFIVWDKIPKGRYYIRFFNIIYSELGSENNDEDFRVGNELIILE